MKRWMLILTRNWLAKFASLAAATLIWLFIKHSIAYSPPSVLPRPLRPPPFSAPLPLLPGD